jgi:hypothetical protein
MNYDSWFIFDPDTNLAESLISSNDLLHKPAGKYGFVQMKNDKMVCEDGTEIKFWGVNICSAKPYSDKKKVDKWCETLAAYGVNGVRFHKFT